MTGRRFSEPSPVDRKRRRRLPEPFQGTARSRPERPTPTTCFACGLSAVLDTTRHGPPSPPRESGRRAPTIPPGSVTDNGRAHANRQGGERQPAVRPFQGVPMPVHNHARTRTLMRVLPILLLTLFNATELFAQSATIVGVVTRSGDGTVVHGATISVVSTNHQTLSNEEGRYVLRAVSEGSHTLVATFLGQEAARRTVEVPGSGTLTVDFELAEAFALSGVVVSASRSVKILQDVPASVSVVTPAEIRRRAPTVQGEELAGISNVAVRDNSEGSFTSVRIRGVPNSHQNNVVLALVDGVPFVTGGDEVDIERLVPTSLVERIEVVKGPTSALYGRGGVAGAINYVTRPAFGQASLEAGFQGGAYGYVRPWASAALPLSPGRNQLLVSGFYEQKDGFVRGADRETFNLFLKDEWLVGDATQLTLYGNVYDSWQSASNHVPFDEELVPLAPIDPRTNYQIPDAGDDRRVAFASARVSHRLRPDLSISTVVHARHHETLTVLGFSDSFSEDQNAFFWNGFGSDESDDTWFLEPQVEWDGGRVRLTAGGSWEAKSGTEFNVWTGENGFPTPDFEFLFYVQKVSATDGSLINGDRLAADTLSDYRYDGAVAAGYAQLEIDLTDRLLLTLGGRYDHFRRDLDVRRPVDGTPTETMSDTEGHFSPKVSLAARIQPDLTAYAAYGEGFNPAFGPPFVFSGRPEDLKPEIARNYEVGVKGSLADGALGFSLAGFRLERHDLLLTLFAEAGRTQSVNAGEHRSTGVEGDIFARLGPDLTATGTYGYVNSKWIDNRFADAFSGDVTDWSGNQVSGVPAHTASVSLSHEGRVFSASTWYDWRSDYWVDNENELEGGGFGLLHASAAVRPTSLDGLELRLTGKNLLDKEYFYLFPGAFSGVEGYRGRPLELLAEVRYAW